MSIERRQVNLKLTPTQEAIIRELVGKLREGGPSYERLVRRFLLDRYEPKSMPMDELNLRFGRIDDRLFKLEHAMADLLAAAARDRDQQPAVSEPVKGHQPLS